MIDIHFFESLKIVEVYVITNFTELLNKGGKCKKKNRKKKQKLRSTEDAHFHINRQNIQNDKNEMRT